MIIIGVDFHPEFQQIALVDTRHRRVPGKTPSASRGGGEVLPRSAARANSACGHGGQRTCALV